MPLTKLQFRPGINRETTSYTNEGGWFDGDKVRFRAGLPEKIGGWLRTFQKSFVGSARSLHAWQALDGTRLIGVGTNLKFYVNEGGGYNDITPIRFTTIENVIVSPAGVSGFSNVGDVSKYPEIGVFGTATVGDVSVGIDGSRNVIVSPAGVLASLLVGDAVTYPELGVFGTGSAGYVSVEIDGVRNVQVDPAGVFATSAVGEVTKYPDIGVVGTGTVGDVSIGIDGVVDTSFSVSGVEASSSVSSAGVSSSTVAVVSSRVDTTFRISGVAASSSLSSLDVTSSTLIFIGDVDTSFSVSGVGASASLSSVGVASSVIIPPAENQITFLASSGSDEIVVTDQDHGAVAGDFVRFRFAQDLGGNITGAILSQEYQISEIVDENNYIIRARTVSTIDSITVDGVITPTYVTANAFDTGGGGDLTSAEYQINTGLDTTVGGTGWGAGLWGRGTWGSGTDLLVIADTLRLWSQDNFGEDLIFNIRDGGIYYWDKSVATFSFPYSRGVPLAELAGSSDAPVVAKQVLVSDVDRHVIAFGTNPLGSTVQDPLLIRFSDQENAADWTPTVTNTAGDLLIGSGSKIVRAVETRQQILVFTDVSLHAMQYVGPPFTFGLSMISENITIAGPMAAVAVDDTVFWMGQEEFYLYSGSVTKLPCTVKDFVFSDLNITQREKIFAATNTSFSEIWWFYPSLNSDDLDRYVVFNYEQNIWYYGTITRTAWIDRGVEEYPIAAGADGHLYYHEIGFDDGSTNPASAIAAYIESSQVDIADGDQFSFVRRIVPDLTFRNSSNGSPSATFTLKARNFPGGDYLQTDNQSVTKSASVPVEQYTNQVFVRLRGRSMALRVSSDDTGVGWRLGSPRIDIRPDGRR